MSNRTIDIGIDLGTTNSTIAIIEDIDARVIPNKGGGGTTPSAIWMPRPDRIMVGHEAKERGARDFENSWLEFKLAMGKSSEDACKTFARNGTRMSPIEASAEVLKELRTDAQSTLGKDISAAVITVPAAFENSSTNATMKSARLAGFDHSPLLLEPVAASLAYGFQSESENEYWFVYDFGGGTFDAAIMRIRDGLIEVVNHEGDNFLGGKCIDWDIVEKLVAPALAERYNLPDFDRGNERWNSIFHQLKFHSEKAKIEVCRTRRDCEIFEESLCEDDDGKQVDVEFTLTAADVERITGPWLAESLRLCENVLESAGLKGSDMKRTLLVGGSTLNPWIRDGIQSELGSEVEYGIDPVTVVARGAAIFASTQILPKSESRSTADGDAWHIEIEGDPVGNVADPDLGGRVQPADGVDVSGHTVELIDKNTGWRSGRITLDSSGVFMTNLYAEKQQRHSYEIVLLDPAGSRIPTTPGELSYMIGVVPDPNPPAARSIGVGLANGRMATYIKKGDKLPKRKAIEHMTTLAIRAGQAEDELRIPFIEGENPRAERNHGIGTMTLRGTDMPHDLPAGTTLEITLIMDKNNLIRVQGYIPLLDEDIEEISFDPEMVHGSADELHRETSAQRKRLDAVRDKARDSANGAQSAIASIDQQGLLTRIDDLSNAAKVDPDSVSELDRKLRQLAASIDEAEDALEWPSLLKELDVSRADADKLIDGLGDDQDRRRLEALKGEAQLAVDSGDPETLRRVIEELDRLWFIVADRQPAYHIGRFERMVEALPNMRDRNQAERLIAQGNRAVSNGDTESLRAAIRQLASLLPRDEQRTVDSEKVGDTLLA